MKLPIDTEGMTSQVAVVPEAAINWDPTEPRPIPARTSHSAYGSSPVGEGNAHILPVRFAGQPAGACAGDAGKGDGPGSNSVIHGGPVRREPQGRDGPSVPPGRRRAVERVGEQPRIGPYREEVRCA